MNLRPSAPKADALPNCATPRNFLFCYFFVPSGCFARPLAVPKFFSGLERRRNLTAALRFARFFCHRQRSQNSPKADALPNCATPRGAFFMLKEYTLFCNFCQRIFSCPALFPLKPAEFCSIILKYATYYLLGSFEK